MRRTIFGLGVLVALFPMVALTQSVQSGPPPNMAFDITKADIEMVLKNVPPKGIIGQHDQLLRAVDMGKYNL